MSLQQDCTEILQLAGQLRPTQMIERLDYWRRGGLPSGQGGEQVSRSRSLSIPTLDRIDRELQEAQRAYRDDLTDARRLLAHAAALEQKFLFKIDVAPEALQAAVSDDPSCKDCGKVRKSGKAWRLIGGRCDACYKAWQRKRDAIIARLDGDSVISDV